jgi:DNA-binding transcriptional LysR family regulator
MNERILSLKVFVRVAYAGSFSKAAAQLGISQPSISRLIKALERELQTPLIARTTRSSRLTAAGKDYLARIEPILTQLEEANSLSRRSGALTGTLRICLSVGLATREVLPKLEAFRSANPALEIEMMTDEKSCSFVQDGIDLALISGELSDSNSTCRRIGTERRIIVASPGYLRTMNALLVPGDFALHRTIAAPPSSDSRIWWFERDGRQISIKPAFWLKVSVDEAAVAAAVQGLGLLMCNARTCQREIERGDLVQVLPDWSIRALPLYALFPGGRSTKRAAKLFVDHLSATLNVEPTSGVREIDVWSK